MKEHIMEQIEDVRYFRLITGEDIIAQVYTEEDDMLVLGFPMKVIFFPVEPTAYRISLMEWIFTRISPDQTFTIKERDIITSSTPSDVIVQYYWDALEALSKKRIGNTGKDTKPNQKEIEDFLEDIEDQLEEEGGSSDFVRELLESLTSNNRNTLH